MIKDPEARRAYMRRYMSDPAKRHRKREANLAMSRARQRLVERHRAEYDVLYAEELGLIRGLS
jgi:hypothetical protein